MQNLKYDKNCYQIAKSTSPPFWPDLLLCGTAVKHISGVTLSQKKSFFSSLHVYLMMMMMTKVYFQEEFVEFSRSQVCSISV